MNVPQDQLDHWRRMAGEVRGCLSAARLHPTANARREALGAADDAARRLALDLEDAGALRPVGMLPRPETPLALLDTPANRRYLDALRAAWEAGLAVDRERYGADIGTDGEAQVVEMLIRDKETEIHGPPGIAGR